MPTNKTRDAGGNPRHVSATRIPTYQMPICETCHHAAARHRMTTGISRKHKECSDGLCNCRQYMPAVT